MNRGVRIGQPNTALEPTARESPSVIKPCPPGAKAANVPAGAELIGEGVMEFDDGRLPSGFLAAGRAEISGSATVVGDFITLGAGSSLQNLVIQVRSVRSHPEGRSPEGLGFMTVTQR
jgi:hypothetical protein